ncbi:MAG: glycosyltransferase family 4 protein [Alphaproteobacteria bacterium]|nr:glycosyltransferase family 4 protein [Alphaproteobacteria bacterium]
MTQKTILFFSNTAFSMWNFRRAVMAHYVAKGFRVLCLAAPDHTVAQIENLGVEFIPIEISRSGMKLIAECRLIRKLYTLFQQYAPELIISYTIKPNIYAPILARILGMKCLCVVTGLGYAFVKKNVRAVMARGLLYLGLYASHKFWVINRDDRVRLCRPHKILDKKCDILPGEGIDTDYFCPDFGVEFLGGHQENETTPHPQRFTFLMVSRILRDKGVVEFCEAFKEVKSRYPHAHAIILGSIDPGNPSSLTQLELKDLCDTCGVEHKDFVQDVRPLIIRSDVCVLPTYYREGIPFSLLEGACFEKPLITTDAPGCRDIVIDRENGLLVEMKSVESLARAMREMLDMSPQDRAQMGARARQICIEKFSISRTLAHYDAVIEQLITNRF